MFKQTLRITSLFMLVLIVAGAQVSAIGPHDIIPQAGGTPSSLGLQGALQYSLSKPIVLSRDVPLRVEPVAAIMSENFEGVWPKTGWSLVDQSSADGGEYLMGKRNCRPRTGTFGGWTIGGGAQGGALSCSANYPDNADTWAEYGPFNLSQATSATLTYYLWGQAESASDGCFDALVVADSINGYQYDHGDAYCGNWISGSDGNGYYRRTLDLSNRLGQPQVWIAFAFLSDSSITYVGMTVDDITLDVVASTPTATRTPTSTPGTPTRTSTPTATRPPGTLKPAAYLPLILRPLPLLCPNDPYEPNGAATQAWGPLSLNQDFLGYFNCVSDTEFDYYFFNLATAGQVVVTLRDIPVGSDYNLALYNCPDATAACRIGYSGNTGNADESITVTTGAGRHIVRINRRLTDPLVSQPYLLRVATR